MRFLGKDQIKDQILAPTSKAGAKAVGRGLTSVGLRYYGLARQACLAPYFVVPSSDWGEASLPCPLSRISRRIS